MKKGKMDMQIMIDIDEETYKEVCWRGLHLCPRNESNLVKSIKNGTPLPKGHGNLKDVDKIISDGIRKGFCDWYDEIKMADTIIEADKEK